MKILVDTHIGRLIVGFLERSGHDVRQASSFAPKISDAEILQIAVAEHRVVMTSDKDFGELVFRLQQPAAGIILLRIAVQHEVERLAVLEKFWPDIERSVPAHFVVVTNRTVRRTPLPELA
jgi:predicted nuclease of predicted toxin-antitoxin system